MAVGVIERTVNRIIEEAEKQIIRFEEFGYGKKYHFIQQAWELVERPLVKYLCLPKGKSVETVCLVIPFQCLSLSRVIKMIGSGKCLMSQIDPGLKLINKISVPTKPYIICNARVEQTANIGTGRRHTILGENLSWCVTNYVDAISPKRAYFAFNSKIGKHPTGIELDCHLNPRIITSINPLSKIEVFSLSCEREIIV